MIELRGLEVRSDAGDKIVSAIVRTEHPDIYDRCELFRNKPVNRGQVRKALGDIYNIEPGHVVWPNHIKVSDI